jgi:hypothetical protein
VEISTYFIGCNLKNSTPVFVWENRSLKAITDVDVSIFDREKRLLQNEELALQKSGR